MKSLLKGLSVAVLLASMSTAFAGGHYYKDRVPCPKLMGGWYVGAQGGYDGYKVEERITTTNNTANPDISAEGFAGGLFAGYGMYWDAFYLGGEVFVNTTGADSNWNINALATDGVFTSKFDPEVSYGVSILPGYRLNDQTTGYVKLGYVRQDTEHKGSIGGAAEVKKSSDQDGFAYGVGMETLLHGNWSVRADYTRVDLGSETNTLSAGNTVKYDVYDNQFMVGVVYHIG